MKRNPKARAKANLGSVMDEAVSGREPILVTRRGKKSVAILPADDLSSLLETVYLLRSPANAARLFRAPEEAEAGKGVPLTVDELARECGLKEED